MIPPLPSTIVATVYITILAILSCSQFYRSRTPLRLGAAVMAIFGLSISALSIVYTTDRLSLSIFWVYQFVAECIAVTWVVTTIIHLGYAFYPLTRHQTLIWRTALGSVVLYDLVAISELSYYCYAVWGSHTLSKEATPVLWIYWVRQVVKVLACAVTIAYLFVPLVRHYNTTGLAMIADSNTLAVGTWYLSALGVTFLGYFSMLIYYMTKPDEVFSPQAQALDLCIRLTACPIFALPPPEVLIRYYQKKYGSTVRDDNPNTVIEDGITNNPQPRRPPMLISQPASFSSRRNSDFHFDHPSTFQGQPSFHTKSPYSSRKWDEDSCKYFMEEAANQGGNSGSGTAAEPSRRLKPHSALPPESPKASDVLDEAVLTSLAVSAQPEDVLMTSLSRKPMQFTPPSSTSTSSPDQGDLDDTTKTARWMSRRSTMEGRRDGLNFLNIGGLIKWSAYPEASLPTTAASSSSSSPATSSSSSTPMTSPAATVHPVPFLSAKSADATPVKYNRDLSDARQGKLSTISYGSLTGDEKEIMVEHLAEARPPAKNEHRQSGSGGVDSQAAVLSDKDGHPHLLFDHGRDVVPSEHRNEGSYRKLQPNDTTPAPGFITKKLSIDNLRRRSRDALARLQEGGLGAALSIPTTSGPLSPIILRSIRNNGAGHSLQSDKARSREDLGSLPESHHSQDESLQDLTSGHRLEPYAEESSAVCI